MMLKEMIVEKSRKYNNILLPCGIFISSIIIANSTAGLFTAPLICALIGACSPICTVAAAAGSIIAYLSSGGIESNGFIICSILFITVGKWITREENTSKISAVVTFLSMAFSGTVFGLIVSKSPFQVIENILFAIASGGAAYFVNELSYAIIGSDHIHADRKTLTSFAVVFTLCISILSGISFSIINIGVVIACTIILCASRFFSCYGGVICGVLTAAGVLISCPELGIQAAFFGAAGLAAGFVHKYSRITLTAVFSAVNLLGQLAVGMNDAAFCIQADAVLGGMIFLMLPERLIMVGGKYCSEALTDSSEFAGKEMEFAAKSLTDIRKNMMEIMSALSVRNKPYNIVDEVSTRVCGKCRNKLECWERNFERTNSVFKKFEIRKINNMNINSAGFECIKKKEVADEFDKCRREEAMIKMLSARLNENRNFLFSQMEASENIVYSLSEKMNVNISKSITETLCRTLDKYDIEFNNAIAYYTDENHFIAEIYIDEKNDVILEELCDILSRELCIKLEYSQPFACSGEIRIRFNQQTKYELTFSFCQMSAEDNAQSGDSCGYFTDGLGYAYIFISDGMGSGSYAALDSEITSRLFKRLVRSGMSCESAVKMINSVMLAKSDEESFATLDIAKINLETGELVLCKSGAAATLIKYDDAVMMYSLSSNPVGIIPNPQTSTKECNFGEGNILIMMSDGVPENAYPYIKEQLEQEIPEDILVENVSSYSKKIKSATMPDDVTVAAAKLIKRQ